MHEVSITTAGNLTADPELRFTPAGHAVAGFVVASTERRLNKETGEWIDAEPTFLRCTVWRDIAEHVAESLRKGDRVIVTGRLRQQNWETPEGVKRSGYQVDVEEIGASVRWATVQITRARRGGPAAAPTGSDDPPADQPPPF